MAKPKSKKLLVQKIAKSTSSTSSGYSTDSDSNSNISKVVVIDNKYRFKMTIRRLYNQLNTPLINLIVLVLLFKGFLMLFI
jgi:hypothetical protein